MEHSEKYEEVLRFYKNRLWSERMTRNAVVKGWITKKEFREITGKEYEDV